MFRKRKYASIKSFFLIHFRALEAIYSLEARYGRV